MSKHHEDAEHAEDVCVRAEASCSDASWHPLMVRQQQTDVEPWESWRSLLPFADVVEMLIETHDLFMPGRRMFEWGAPSPPAVPEGMLLNTKHKSLTAVN